MRTLRCVTANINWAIHNEAAYLTEIRTIMPYADVIFVQEAKFANLTVLRDKDWDVHQVMTNEATRGVAIIWRKAIGPVVARGLLPGVNPGGARLLERPIAWIDLKVGGEIWRFASFHYPPKRFRFLWSASNRAVGQFVRISRRHKVPFIMGSDTNDNVPHDAHGLRRLFNVVVKGVRIDGFIIARRFNSGNAQDLGHITKSDHNPIRINIWR